MKTNSTRNAGVKIASLFALTFLAGIANAGVIVTSSKTMMEISADKAANALNPAYTQVGDIKIEETKMNDFANSFGQSKTLVLTAPAGWVFKPNSGHVSVNGKDITAASIKTTWTFVTISFTVNATASMDVMNIAGIEVQANDGIAINNEGSIYRSSSNPGTASIKGIVTTKMTNGAVGTAFTIMSQTSGIATKLVFSNKPFASTAGVAFDQQPVIVTQDQFGNQTSNGLNGDQNVRIKLSSGTGTLSGTVVMNISTGMASFSDLQLDAMGAKKLIATSGSLSFAVSNEFNITESESSPRISSEDADDYDPDWICFLQNPTSATSI